MKTITEKIEKYLSMSGTHYFTVKSEYGELIKIRVSDHSMNRTNNGDQKTISFISNRTEQRKSAYNSSVNEWLVMDNGLTDTYEELEYILSEEGAVSL